MSKPLDEKKGDNNAAGEERPADTEQRQSGSATDVSALQERIRELELELEEARKAYLYERAELENFKKRMQRERAELMRYASEPLIRDLLPVVDNLERALQHARSGEHSIIEGVQLVLKMLLEALSRHGVSRIEAAGEVFDPHRHEAVAHVESEEHQVNRVTEQHQVGYLLHDRLLRPALVSVGRGRSDATDGKDAVASTGNSD
jgi:molecular chaperone GrpE